MTKSLAAIALVALLASGCAQTATETTSTTTEAPRLDAAQQLAAQVTIPPAARAFDGNWTHTWWDTFATNTPLRNAFLPNNQVAADLIATTLKTGGLDVEVREYPAGALGASAPAGAGPAVVRVVVGTKAPANVTSGQPPMPDHAIVIGAHYDTAYPVPAILGQAVGTLEGAYDNGSGVAVALATCLAMAASPMHKTLVCLFFDGEELGTVGSLAYVADTGSRQGLTLDAYLGFDMVGLNWPGYDAWKLYAWTGAEFAGTLFPIVNGTLHDVLGYPETGSQAFPFNDRNSDEASFADAHVPTVRFAGGRRAGDYPMYHMPGDTVAYVEDFAGGAPKLVAGFDTAIRTAVQVGLELDNMGPIPADA